MYIILLIIMITIYCSYLLKFKKKISLLNVWFLISGQTITVVPITRIELYLENEKTLGNCGRILPSKRVAQNVSGCAARYSTI